MTKHHKPIAVITSCTKRLALILAAGFVALIAHAQPAANFTANITSGCAPLVVNFTDQSTGSITDWKWDLGNGVISAIKNPSTTYFNPGLYTVKLVVVAANGKDSLVRTNYINIISPPQIAFSTSTGTVGCFPLRVQFVDNSTPSVGTLTAWDWDFGDGTTSTQQNPFKVYTTAGNYNVTLKVTNSSGCAMQLVKPSFIRVTPGVKADFSSSQPVNCKPPELINFTNLSSGPGTLSYNWNFGDGNSSVQQNPSHTYITAGLFNVQLIVQSDQGCTDTITKNNSLSIGAFQSSFNVADKICLGDTANFQNTSMPNPPNSTWYFGDGTTSFNKNPSKIYTAPGFYTVKLVNNYGACLDSASKTIEVVNNPVPVFTATQTAGCKFPFTTNFQDNTPGATQWRWDFGDGNTSPLQNPTHTYNAFGIYNVTLTVTTTTGCKGTLTKNNFILIAKPVITVNGLPNGGCVPFTINPTATVMTVDAVNSWLWVFGDGATAVVQNPSHTYNSAGTYTVKLFITTTGGCTDSLVFTNGVRTGTNTVPNFSATPLTVCAGAPVQFTDLSTGNPDQWLWEFGDGTSSSSQNPIHAFDTTGVFTVKLTSFNNRCGDSTKKINYITVLPPVARFTVNNDCNNRNTISFTDNSIGATAWQWDFGDGNTSNIQNPTHTYITAGTFNVKLTVTNGGCSNSITKTVNVITRYPGLSLTYDQGAKCKNIPFQFTAVTIPANTSNYMWRFSDGATATGSSTTHAFTVTGPQWVQLITTDLNGCLDSTAQKTLQSFGPIASFTFIPNPQCTGQDVTFNNTSTTDGTNAITSALWNFGDGNTTNNINPSVLYKYTQPGSYTAKLKITDAFGCSDSITAAQTIDVLKLSVDFKAVDSASCPGGVVQFNNLSIGSNLTYTWYFGDGNTSNAINPAHSYTVSGKYTVKLVARESIGCIDSAFKTNYINIDVPKASFDASDTFTICPPLQVQFTNKSTYYRTVQWKFGDGNESTADNPRYSYSIPNDYTVTLIVTSAGGCVDSVKKTIRVLSNTKGVLTYNPLAGCYPQTINFKVSTDNPVKYFWDFGDGTTLFTPDSIQNFSYTYPGFYVPKVTLQDAQGCLTPVFGTDTIKIFGAKADFGLDKILFCDNGTVQFRDSTVVSDIISSTLWNFGDGNTSNLKNPSHTYNNPGLYTVSLTINTANGCSNTKTKPNLVKVVTSPQISINGTTVYCSPANASLNGVLLNADTSALAWKWNINNLIYNSQDASPITIPNAGSYPVVLSVINSSGCVDTSLATIIVNQTPTINAGIDTTICLGSSFTLQPTGGATYSWSPSSYLSCTNCTNPVSTPTDNITYYVTGASAQACTNKDTINVRVKKPFTITALGNADVCVGKTVQLTASGAENYSWSPVTGLSNPTISNPKANPAATTTYQVIGYDSSLCFYDTAYVQVNVYPYPTVDTGKDTTIMGGTSIQLNPVASNDVASWFWSPSGTLSCVSCPNPIAKPVTNTTYTAEVKNSIGCTTYDEIKITVLCADGKIYLPTAFTPNNDGKNDWFYVMGNGVQSVKSFQVFDRWGKIIFDRKNFPANSRNDGWNGQANGVELPMGIYPYVAEVICGDGALFKLNGSVTLIR